MIYFLYLIVIVFLNSFIAGARNDNIGTDISFYAYRVFHTDAYLDLEDAEIDLTIVLLAKFWFTCLVILLVYSFFLLRRG